MVNEKELRIIAGKQILSVFSQDYLTESGACQAYGFCDDNTYQLFVGIKGEKDLPGRKPTLKDWVVYALVRVDAHTGEVKQFDYVLE
jgi:hypothetical protein